MNNWLIFLGKSTLILSVLYLLFRLVMRKEAFFNLNRMILIFIVLISVIIPFISLPDRIHPVASIRLDPIFSNNLIIEDPVQVDQQIPGDLHSSTLPSKQPIVFSVRKIVLFVYMAGVFISLISFVISILSVLRLLKKSKKAVLNGIRLMILDGDTPAFSFRRSILISRHDYNTNFEAIYAHELLHIRQGHFYDLMLIELTKIVYWFNPLVFYLSRDLKEVHEFQADKHALSSGIDATGYQLLIIQKCVGPRMFALANSFNYCHIKTRIAMMNKSNINKVMRWKAAAFLPLLAVLLMAFAKRGEIVSENLNLPEIVNSTELTDPVSLKLLSRSELISEYKNNTGNIIAVFINSRSELMINGKKVILRDVEGSVYSSYESAIKEKLGEPTPDVFNRTLPDIKLIVQKDAATNEEDYKNLIDLVGSVIFQVQEKYSNAVFGEAYKSLSQINREKISTLIKPEIFIAPDKRIASKPVQNQQGQFSPKIEIRKDGNYIDGKLCTLDELVKKAQEWKKAANVWIRLTSEPLIPMKRIDEVRDALAKGKVYHVTQSEENSDDIVYFMGDVTKQAKLKQGKFDDWLKNQLKNYPEIQSEISSKAPVIIQTVPAKDNRPETKLKMQRYMITVSFIVGRDGRVRDAHIVKPSGYPKTDAAWEKVLSQIPDDWEPAKRGSEIVSVYYHTGMGSAFNVTKP